MPFITRNSKPFSLVLCRLAVTLLAWSAVAHAAAGSGLDAAVAGEQEIEVHLQSGRVFWAVVDSRSDEQKLWLRFSSERAQVLRPVGWNSVSAIVIDGESTDVAALRAAVQNHGQNDQPVHERAVPLAPPPALALAEQRSRTRQEFTATFQASIDRGPSPETGRPVPARVRSVMVDASVANWDGDVEADGLVVYLQPVDEVGQMLPVRGDVAFDLVGNYPSVIYRPQPLAPLARWTRRVQATALTPRGILFKLPFQALHPDLQTNVGPYALLHCRLSVPGLGTFDETVAVRIRQANPLRDQLQKLTGSRFYGQEWLGRTQ